MNYAITQGRLSPPIDNKIQSFPQKTWKDEFKYANKIGLKYIEWVIDYKSIESNPIFHKKGINEINKLKKKYKIKTITIQCDFILHKPFWKKKYKKYKKIIDNKINYLFSLNNEFKNSIFIIPLLENSKVNSLKDENFIISYFKDKISILKKNNHKIAFEVDFKPKKVSKFIKKLDKKYFGINYDTGNSISNNFNYKEEIKTYFKRVINIHYKDKNSKNKSVYLGEGKFAAALSSGTAAIHLGLLLLGVKKGDEVICQSLTFSASANPILYIGAVPIFVDSELDTWNICPVALENAINHRISIGKKPKAIIAVHLYGVPYKVEEIRKIANKYEIPILEDSAEALGSTYKGKKMWNFW